MSESASHFRLPFELIEGDEHHGPYITNNYGSNVCDFYTMSNPSALSVRNGGDSKPIWFADAKDNAAFMCRAANAHDALVAALRVLHDNIAEYARINDLGGYDNQDMRQARAALKLAEGQP